MVPCVISFWLPEYGWAYVPDISLHDAIPLTVPYENVVVHVFCVGCVYSSPATDGSKIMAVVSYGNTDLGFTGCVKNDIIKTNYSYSMPFGVREKGRIIGVFVRRRVMNEKT